MKCEYEEWNKNIQGLKKCGKEGKIYDLHNKEHCKKNYCLCKEHYDWYLDCINRNEINSFNNFRKNKNLELF